MKLLYNNEDYQHLTVHEKETVLKQIAADHPQFTLERLEEFCAFGRQHYTAVYACASSHFVFVPGTTCTTLGWHDFATEPDAATREEFDDLIAEYDIQTPIEDVIRATASPVRDVPVGPMLVEQIPRGIGWLPIDINHPSLQKEELADYLQKTADKPDGYSLTVHNGIKITKKNGVIAVYKYQPISYDALLAQVQAEGFALPTEDEWEYLCGGGSRTLWRWGDSFCFDVKVRHFEVYAKGQTVYGLEEPNEFGLKIAYDPYQMELIEDARYLAKGGDGGCLICGGNGPVIGYLPVSTSYRGGWDLGQQGAKKPDDVSGDYTRYRRVYHLE